MDVPAGYVSGTYLSSTATFNNVSLASMHFKPGVYVWTWGSGINAGQTVLYLGMTPEPISVALGGVGELALIGLHWRRCSRKTTTVTGLL